MDTLQLTGSAVFDFDGLVHTLFIASEDGRCGVVAAGSWETVIPFRFDRIEALADGGFVAWRRGRRTVYHVRPDAKGVRAVPARRELSPAGRAARTA